ncbi:MAG: glycine cleavage system protein GcvH [Kiritimatiellia bacterium]
MPFGEEPNPADFVILSENNIAKIRSNDLCCFAPLRENNSVATIKLKENDMTPDDRKYTKSHEWIKTDGELAVVGITGYAQSSLGDMTFIDPRAVGKALKQGDECAVLESVKAASEVYAPVDGEIAEINDALEDAPELVNNDPYGEGWILKLKGVDLTQLDGLMDAAAYNAIC